MKFIGYSFTFTFVFCFVLLLCTALQAELVRNYDSDTEMTIINTEPSQVMVLNPWKQPRLSITIQYPDQNAPPSAELEVKMSFISLSRERKFDDCNVIQFYVDGKLVFQKKYELDTNVRKKSVMETMTVKIPYYDFEKMMEVQRLKLMFCKEGIFKYACPIEFYLLEIEREDIPWVRDLLR